MKKSAPVSRYGARGHGRRCKVQNGRDRCKWIDSIVMGKKRDNLLTMARENIKLKRVKGRRTLSVEVVPRPEPITGRGLTQYVPLCCQRRENKHGIYSTLRIQQAIYSSN